MKAHGFEELPLYKHRPAQQQAKRQRWMELAKLRDGPVSTPPMPVDIGRPAAEIKEVARRIGADDVGIARLTPVIIRKDFDLPHDYAICMIVAEGIAEALKGPRATEEEATSAYVRCAEIATELASYIRSRGYPAVAHHNGACDVQAIPAMIAAGLGEIGKHRYLLHRGVRCAGPTISRHRRHAIALAAEHRLEFGVQDTCLHCNLCSNNCPARHPAKRIHFDGRHPPVGHRRGEMLRVLAAARGILPHLRGRVPLYSQGQRRCGQARALQALHGDTQEGRLQDADLVSRAGRANEVS